MWTRGPKYHRKVSAHFYITADALAGPLSGLRGSAVSISFSVPFLAIGRSLAGGKQKPYLLDNNSSSNTEMLNHRERHALCDCVLEVHQTRDGIVSETDDVYTIEAHRVFLARAPFMERLFVRDHYDREERDAVPEADSPASCLMVYRLNLPFDQPTLAFVIELLYEPPKHAEWHPASNTDPADVVACALYMGLSTKYIHILIDDALRVLLDRHAVDMMAPAPQWPTAVSGERLPPTPDDGEDTASDLCAFLQHMLASGIPGDWKESMIARTMGVLDPRERDLLLAAQFPDTVRQPLNWYRPGIAKGGEVHIDDDGGRTWDVLRFSFDWNHTKADFAVTLTHADLDFYVAWHARCSSKAYRWKEASFGSSVLTIRCEPHCDDPEPPTSHRTIEGRVARFHVRTYHPLLGTDGRMLYMDEDLHEAERSVPPGAHDRYDYSVWRDICRVLDSTEVVVPENGRDLCHGPVEHHVVVWEATNDRCGAFSDRDEIKGIGAFEVTIHVERAH